MSFTIPLLFCFMKRKVKQWWSSIPPISTKGTITSHLNWTQGPGGSMSYVVGLPNSSYKLSPIRHRFMSGFVNYKKGCTRLASDKVYQLLAHGRWFSPDVVSSIQHHVTKFVDDLRQVSGFLRVLRFPPPMKLTVTI